MAKRFTQVQAKRTAKTPESPNLTPAPIQHHSPVAGSPTMEGESFATATARKLEMARRQYRSVVESESQLRRDMYDDRRFRLGRLGDEVFQWPDHVAQQRKADRRPVLQVNRVAGFVDMARNQGDNANLRITVNPVDDLGDPKVAAVLSGMIRNVEVRSFAGEDAYSSAGDAQCEMGRGYMWLATEYESERSFRQRALIKRIINPFRVKVDATAQEKDQSDAEFSFYDIDIDEDTWKARYGKGGKQVPTENLVDWGDIGDAAQLDWFPSKGRIRMTHWFCAEYESDTLYELRYTPPSGKKECHTDDIDDEVERLMDVASRRRRVPVDHSEEGFKRAKKRFLKTQVLRKRAIERRVMKWRLIDALYIHMETEWPTPWQPLIPMMGDESDLDGVRDVRGVVRDAKDSQRVYNVMVSSQAEAVNDMPKMPFIGWRGQFGKPGTPQNNAWKDHPIKKLAYLEADPVDLDGKVLPQLPTRNYGTTDLAAYNHALMQADNDMKATARVHDASLGEGPVDKSGKALQARQRQDEIANSHLTMNRRRALASCGRQLIRLFRTIYDTATIVRITGADDQKQKYMIFNGAENDPRKPGNGEKDPRTGEQIPFKLPEGVKEIFDIGTGEYDVEVTAGPHPGTRRQEDLDIIGNLIKALPPQYTVNFMDLLFKLIDTPIGRQMSERADKLLSPGLRDQNDGKGNQIPPEVQQQMLQMQQRQQQLMQALKQAADTIRTKKMELASKEQIAAMQQYVELVKVMVTEGNEDRRQLLQHEIDRIHKFLDMATARIEQAEAEGEEDAALAEPPAAEGAA